jgi:type 1 glutamine amidotransferase
MQSVILFSLLVSFSINLAGSAGLRVLDFTAVINTINYHPEAQVESKILFDKLAKDRSWTLVHSEDPALFTDTGLAKFDVVIFNNTGGNVFNAAQKLAMENFIKKGGGFAGIHAATFTHKEPPEWAWWHDLVGMYHTVGPPQRGYVGVASNTIIMQDTSKLFTTGLTKQWTVGEVEWYHYDRVLPASIHVLATANPNTDMGGYPAYYPVSWCHHYSGGRAWYTNNGHYASNFKEPNSIQHMLVGIEWAGTRNAGGCEEAPTTEILVPKKSAKDKAATESLNFAKEARLAGFNALGSQMPPNSSRFPQILWGVPAH